MPTKKNAPRRVIAFLEKLHGPVTFGRFLESIRVGEGWSLADMGTKVGISRTHVCDIEKGRRTVTPEKAASWARILGYDESQMVRMALQAMLDASGLNMDVEVKPTIKRRA